MFKNKQNVKKAHLERHLKAIHTATLNGKNSIIVFDTYDQPGLFTQSLLRLLF